MRHLLLVDIKNSKAQKPRKLWTVLNNLCKRVNTKFKLASPMVITLGDEFQMVCDSKTQAFEVLEYLQNYLNPLEFRAVVTAYDKSTKHIDSPAKMKKILNQTSQNPLLSKKYTAAHNLLDQKHDGIILLD